MKNLTVETLTALLAKCSLTASILISTENSTSLSDEAEEVTWLQLIEYRTYAIEGELNTPEVIIHSKIPNWKALNVRVVSQSERFVETIYEEIS